MFISLFAGTKVSKWVKWNENKLKGDGGSSMLISARVYSTQYQPEDSV
jgi:hypothetical protein